MSVLYYPAEYGFEDELSIFLSKYFPFTTKFTSNQSFDDACNIVFDKNADLRSHNTFLKDIFFRYPGLSKIIDNIDIGILITSRKESVCNSRKLNLYIGNDGDWFTFQSLVDIKCQPVSALYLKNINQNFWSFIKDILINTDKNIFEFSIINKTERNTLMQKWNNTDYFYDNKKLLHQYFEEQVINAPKSTALIYGNKLMTYESLNAKANKLGYYLRKKGVTSNDLVGILMGRSFEMVICILGVLKSGGAYIPIDPKSPVSRKLYILENSQARFLLVTDENVQENLDGYKNELINVNKVLLSDSETYTNLKILNTSNSIAYSIYTSGTTGFPKGVAVSHKAICNHMIWMQRKYGFSKNDIFLQKTPFTFDASIWEFFAPLLVGAKIVIAPNDAHLYPNILINLVQSHKVTVLQLVPTMLRELLNCVGFKRCVSLRYLFSGGEALLPKDIKVFFKHKPRLAKLHNLYGPTETTIQVLTNTCTRKDYENNLNIIGKPIHNTRVYILDDMRQLVPVGISGELYIAGDCLAAGYLNNKKLTQQKFVNNPFSSEKNSLLYKTGDLAKWLPDGNVEYLGRLDSQVKIRGFRIEINEIEANLVKITDIEQSIVSAEPNLDDTMSLSAYLILKEGSQLTIKKIRKFLENYLPEYMIPTNYFIVDKFIITPSGKIDRKLLPTTKMQLDSGIDYIAPTNDVEKILSNIWCAAFKFEKVGIYDDFFDLGGNSLLAMKIITSIENHLLVKLSIRALFEHSTICLLSEEIEKNYHEKSLSGTNLIKNCIVPIKSSGTKLPVFLIHPIGGSVFWYKLFGSFLEQLEILKCAYVFCQITLGL